MILSGGLMTALGVWGDLGAVFLIAFLIPTTLYMHGYWKFQDEQMRQQQQMHFMKNTTLIGGAFGLLALFVCGGTGLGLAITGPVLT